MQHLNTSARSKIKIISLCSAEYLPFLITEADNHHSDLKNQKIKTRIQKIIDDETSPPPPHHPPHHPPSSSSSSSHNEATHFHTSMLVLMMNLRFEDEGYDVINREICRSQKIPFMAIQVTGLIGYVFVDVGDDFHYSILSDTRPKKVIERIDENGIIKVADKFHQFPVGSLVQLKNVGDVQSKQYFEENGPFSVIDFISENEFQIEVDSEILRSLSLPTCGSVEEISRILSTSSSYVCSPSLPLLPLLILFINNMMMMIIITAIIMMVVMMMMMENRKH